MPASPLQIDFTGRRVVVAGGSRGIGRSIALAFATAGADVSLCARGQAALDATAADIGQLGVKVHAASVDLADASALERYIAAAGEALGGIDVLVNNGSAFGFADDEDGWQDGLDVDIMATVRASRHALPWLQRADAGCIVNTVSIAALRPRGSGSPYAAVKAAVTSYTGSLALQLAPRGIRVNAIAPGSIDFADGLWDKVHRDDPERYRSVVARIPSGRMGRPEEIAHAALFLASPLASWVTGHTLVVDGGQMLNG